VPGNRYGWFRWVDREVTANGSAACDSVTWNYQNVELEKGWNELTTTPVSPRERQVSASHPADLGWHLLSYGLGYSCDSDCNGTACQRGGGGYERICAGSDLELPCVGTAAGMYCSMSCVADADCENANEPMRCLPTCATFPDLAGKCWTDSALDFLNEAVCP
jgi:hypothetical protein